MVEPKGVWRTVRGRRIWIGEGQSLEDAMKKSGKFDLKKKVSNADEVRKKVEEMRNNKVPEGQIQKYIKLNNQRNELERQGLLSNELKDRYDNEIKSTYDEGVMTYSEEKKLERINNAYYEYKKANVGKMNNDLYNLPEDELKKVKEIAKKEYGIKDIYDDYEKGSDLYRDIVERVRYQKFVRKYRGY